MAKKSTATKSSTTTTTVTTKKVEKNKMLSDTPLMGMGIAEFVGTFLLVSSIFAVHGQPLFVAFGLIGLVLIFGGISGSHLNPAITIGALATKRIKSKQAVIFIVAQLLGALAAFSIFSGVLSATAPSGSDAMMGGSQLFHVVDMSADEATTKGKEWVLFVAELLGVFALSLGVATALREKKQRIVSATAVGMALLVGLLLASSITQVLLVEQGTTLTYLNPAAAMSGYVAGGVNMFDLWPIMIFVIAPSVGAVLGFGLSDVLERSRH